MAVETSFLKLLACLSVLLTLHSVVEGVCPILSRFPICNNYEVMAKTKDAQGCDQFECLPCPLPRFGCYAPSKFEPIPNSADPGQCPQFECKTCYSLRNAPRPSNCHVTAWEVKKDANNCVTIVCKNEEEKEKPIVWSKREDGIAITKNRSGHYVLKREKENR